MASVFDVAAYILSKAGPMTAMKLQKLVYYCQAWSLVWDEKAIFGERVEAWANGPVVPPLFRVFQGQFMVSKVPQGSPGTLNQVQRDTVDAILGYYGDKPSQWLSDLTHLEDPWKDARAGLPAGKRGNVEITHAAMAEYYGSL